MMVLSQRTNREIPTQELVMSYQSVQPWVLFIEQVVNIETQDMPGSGGGAHL